MWNPAEAYGANEQLESVTKPKAPEWPKTLGEAEGLEKKADNTANVLSAAARKAATNHDWIAWKAEVAREGSAESSENVENFQYNRNDAINKASISLLDVSSEEAVKLATDLDMKDQMDSLWVKPDESGNISEIGSDMTPEELEQNQTDLAGQKEEIYNRIQTLDPKEDSELIKELQDQETFLWSMIDAIFEKNNPNMDTGVRGSFDWLEVTNNKNVVETAKKYEGIHESTWEADKFLCGKAKSAKSTPWCAGFVSYVCKESGYDVTPTLSSRAFIWESGFWHVAFSLWNWEMIWWNQSNKVSVQAMNQQPRWWIMPEEYAAWKPPHKWWSASEIPEWAIVVFGRSTKQKKWA